VIIMARISEAEPLGMPTKPELAALLAEHGLVECPPHREQAIGFIGLLFAMADPPAPPMTVLGQLGREPIALRVGFDIVMRDPGEGMDEFRIRVHRLHGGVADVRPIIVRVVDGRHGGRGPLPDDEVIALRATDGTVTPRQHGESLQALVNRAADAGHAGQRNRRLVFFATYARVES
jgi:hypothetical protein